MTQVNFEGASMAELQQHAAELRQQFEEAHAELRKQGEDLKGSIGGNLLDDVTSIVEANVDKLRNIMNNLSDNEDVLADKDREASKIKENSEEYKTRIIQ